MDPSKASPMDSIKDQEMTICFNIGIRCISILQYLIESMERWVKRNQSPNEQLGVELTELWF